MCFRRPHLISSIVTLGTKINWNQDTVEHEIKHLVPETTEVKVPSFAKHLYDMHGNEWKSLMLNTAGMMNNLAEHHLKAEDLRQIQQSALLCLGDGDRMVTRDETEHAALMIPHGKFHLLENTPHPIEKVNPHLLASIISDFNQH